MICVYAYVSDDDDDEVSNPMSIGSMQYDYQIDNQNIRIQINCLDL